MLKIRYGTLKILDMFGADFYTESVSSNKIRLWSTIALMVVQQLGSNIFILFFLVQFSLVFIIVYNLYMTYNDVILGKGNVKLI